MTIITLVEQVLRPFRLVASVTIYLCIGMLIFLSLDRSPPFSIPPIAPAEVHAGEWAVIDIPVRRDLTRHCDATFSRYIFDSTGARFDISAQQEVSDDFIRGMEKLAPGRLQIKFLIPPAGKQGIALGDASLVTSLTYQCNAVHTLWPIKVRTLIPLRVLP